MNDINLDKNIEDDEFMIDDDCMIDDDYMDDDNVDHMVDNTVENKPFENIASENKPDADLDVPIDINVQLGTLVVNKDSAMSMEQGDVLKFETSCPGEVSLVFQGREIGRGKLVDIEGYLGVQITHNWCRS